MAYAIYCYCTLFLAYVNNYVGQVSKSGSFDTKFIQFVKKNRHLVKALVLFCWLFTL